MTDRGMTIEELAQETGMTVRNIRNHQSRGLLPPPEVRARTGFYGEHHVERIRLIQQMQADGFNLKAIKRLIGDAGSADRILGFRRAVTAPYETEAPEILTAEDLAARFGPYDAKVFDQALKLDLLVPVGDGRFEAPSPALLRAAETAVQNGIPLRPALAAMGRVKKQCEAAARTFVDLFLEETWKPFAEAGQPEERWPEVIAAIERLRPVASEALLGMFRQTMAVELEAAFEKALDRQSRRG